MSVVASAAVWKNSRAKGNQLLVMLALADFARDDGHCWPSIDTVSKYARIGRRATQRAIRTLVEAGELSIDEGGGRHKTNTYRILIIEKGVKETLFNLTERASLLTERAAPATPDPLLTIKNRKGRKRTPPVKTETPEAVEAYRRATQRYPNKATWSVISETVGEDVARWEKTVGAYVLMGWNPANVSGMLEYFKRGEIPAPGQKNGSNTHTGMRLPDGI
jgi:hypothetical protein